jgi:hypothetical protein
MEAASEPLESASRDGPLGYEQARQVVASKSCSFGTHEFLAQGDDSTLWSIVLGLEHLDFDPPMMPASIAAIDKAHLKQIAIMFRNL